MSQKPLYDVSSLNAETRAILIFAGASARVYGRFSVTSDDVFLGILHMPHTDAAQALKRCGITLERCVQRWPMMPRNITGECAYTVHVENIVRHSIARAKKEGRTYASPSDLLLTMLESLKGGDKEVDAVFEDNADAIQMALQTIKQENSAKAAASVGEKI